jgi:hypothetical protein
LFSDFISSAIPPRRFLEGERIPRVLQGLKDCESATDFGGPEGPPFGKRGAQFSAVPCTEKFEMMAAHALRARRMAGVRSLGATNS